MGPFFAGRLADRILLAKDMTTDAQPVAGKPVLNCLFILPSKAGVSAFCSAPSELGGFYWLLLEKFLCKKAKSRSLFFPPFYLLLFFLWQRVNSELKALWHSWVWHLSLEPACPICFYIYTTRDTLASFFQTCDAFGFSFGRAQMLRGLIKRWVVELKGSCFFGPDLFLDIMYCYFFFTFSLAR